LLRARAWAGKGDSDRALADLDAAIRFDPDDPATHVMRGVLLASKSDFSRALADFDAAIAADAEFAPAFLSRAEVRSKTGEYDRAIADFETAVRLDPDEQQVHNNLAWLRATCPDARYRDGKQAVAEATRACELTEWQEWGVLDTLAAACAEAGDFDAAVKWQNKALELAGDDENIEEARARLELYETSMPYREEPGAK
jgi:Tfp pilus assembly protein PilF